MDRGVPANVPDGAFERFLTSAIATILTLIFSWRFLLEADDANRKALEDVGSKSDKYMDPDEVDEDTKPYTARAGSAYGSLPSDNKGEPNSKIQYSSASNKDVGVYATGIGKPAVTGKGNPDEEGTSLLDRSSAGDKLCDLPVGPFGDAQSAERAKVADNDSSFAAAVSESHNSRSVDATFVSSRQASGGDDRIGLPASISAHQSTMLRTENSANGAANNGVSVDGKADTASPLSTWARPRISQTHLTGNSGDTVGSWSPGVTLSTSARQKALQAETKDAKPGYFRPKLPTKWLEDGFDDDDVFEDDTPSMKKSLPGDLAADLSSVPHRKLKEFEQFLASEDISENQLGARLLEQYLLHEANLDDSSESDYCDFNRTLDTITEEDTSDLESSDSEEDAKVKIISRTGPKKGYLRRNDSDPSKESGSMDKPSYSRESSLDDTEPRHSQSDTFEHISDAGHSTDSGSIDVRFDIDPSADSSHRYANIKPQRALIIGPYQDRDSAFSKGHFIDTIGGLNDKERGICVDDKAGGKNYDNEGTPGLALGVQGNLSSPSRSCSDANYQTEEIPAAEDGEITAVSLASIAEHTSSDCIHGRDTNEVEAAGLATIKTDAFYNGRQNQNHLTGIISSAEQGLTEKSIIHEKIESQEQQASSVGFTSKSDVTSNLASITEARESRQAGLQKHEPLISCVVKPQEVSGEDRSHLHNKVNRRQHEGMMDSNSQVAGSLSDKGNATRSSDSLPGSRAWETATGIHSRLHSAGGGSGLESHLDCDQQTGDHSARSSTATPTSSCDRDLSIFDGYQIESSSNPSDSELKDTKHRYTPGSSARPLSLADDQGIESSGKANTKAADRANCTFKASAYQHRSDNSNSPENNEDINTSTLLIRHGSEGYNKEVVALKGEETTGDSVWPPRSAPAPGKRSVPPTIGGDKYKSVDLNSQVTKITDAKEFASGESSPKKWIFTSVKNKYTFEVPVKSIPANDKGDKNAVRYHSTGENLGVPSKNTPFKIKTDASQSKSFKDIQRAIQGQYSHGVSCIPAEEFNTNPSAIFDKKSSGKPLPTVETYRFYHNKIEVPFLPESPSTTSTKEQSLNGNNSIKGDKTSKVDPTTTEDSRKLFAFDSVNTGEKPSNSADPHRINSGKHIGLSANTYTDTPVNQSDSKRTENTDTNATNQCSYIYSVTHSTSSSDKTASGEIGRKVDGDLDTSGNSVTKYSQVADDRVCTAVATSTALAKREPNTSDPEQKSLQETAVSAVASAEASGLNPYIAIGRASARAATVATASAAHSIISKDPSKKNKRGNIAVVISTSCKIKGDDEIIERDAETVIQSLDSSVKSSSLPAKKSIMDAATQSSPDMQEKRRKFRVTIEQPDSPACTKETRTIEFELPPGTDASQFSSLITNAVKKIMDDSSYSDSPHQTEQARFDDAVQKVAREVMQAYTTQAGQPQSIQVKRRKKNKNCFYVKGISRNGEEEGRRKVLGVISDGGKPPVQSEQNNNDGGSIRPPSEPRVKKSRTKKPKPTPRNSIPPPAEVPVKKENVPSSLPIPTEQLNDNDCQMEPVKSPTSGEVKLKGILKKSKKERVEDKNVEESYTADKHVSPPANKQSIIDTVISQPFKGMSKSLKESLKPKPAEDPEIQIGKHAWPPSRYASLTYNWPPRGEVKPTEPRVKQEYKSILQEPVPADTRTPLSQLKKYVPPEKIPSETKSRLMESRRGYFSDERSRSKSTSELDEEFEARKPSEGSDKAKSNFVLVDIDLSTSPKSSPSKIEKLKQRIAASRPRAPNGSYVDKVWNAKELISKSQEKGLNKLRDYKLNGEAPLSPSQASSIESLRRSKSLGLLPSTFFANKEAYPCLTETDLDSGVSKETPLVHETNIDDMSEKSKSMGNLQEDEIFKSNALATDFDKHKSLLVVSDKPDDDDEVFTSPLSQQLKNYDQNKSAHEIRISKSLSKLNVPSWYTNSQRQNQEVVSLSNAKQRDLPFSGQKPWRNQADDAEKDRGYETARPVVIQHRVRSPYQSPANSLPNTPASLSVFDNFELPSARFKRNTPQYKTLPIRPFNEVTDKRPKEETKTKRPAKEAYLELKEDLERPPPERNMRSHKSLPRNMRLETDIDDMQPPQTQEININKGGFKVARPTHDATPSVQQYSNQTQITVEATVPVPQQAQPNEVISGSTTTHKERSKRKGKRNKSSSSSLADSGRSSMEFDKCLTTTGVPESQSEYVNVVPPPQTQQVKPQAQQHQQQIQSENFRDNRPYQHHHKDSTNDSGIVDINTFDDYQPRTQQYRLTQGELDERNRIIGGEESIRYGYESPNESAAQYTQPSPQRPPLHQYVTEEMEEMPPLVRDEGPKHRPRPHASPPQRSPYPGEMEQVPPRPHPRLPSASAVYQNNAMEQQPYVDPYGTPLYTNVQSPSPPPSAHLHGNSFSYEADNLQTRAFDLLHRAAEESSRSLNVSMVSTMSFDVEMVGDDTHFPPISDNKTNVVVSEYGEEVIWVKCRNPKCGKTQELDEARKSYKTCHNCFTYYCSRECRKAHWEKHKKRCLFSKVNSVTKYILKRVHDDEALSVEFSRIASEGYQQRGPGCVLLVFSSHVKAEEFLVRGMQCSEALPVYCSIDDIHENANTLGEHQYELLDMCRSYNPGIKFVLDVVVIASLGAGEVQARAPRKDGLSVKKCTKLRLTTNQNVSAAPTEEPETLILTAMANSKSDPAASKKSREICFNNIQKQLRHRGVSLRHHYPDIYGKLCSYVEDNEVFMPITIFPYNEETGRKFMCLIMPNSDPDTRWSENPEVLRQIGLKTTEL